MKYIAIILIGWLLFTINLYSQTDLILDNQGITLSGYNTYNNITLINNSTIWVGGDGELIINADSIFIDATSQINADGVSSSGPGNGGLGQAFTMIGGSFHDAPLGGGGGGAGMSGPQAFREYGSQIQHSEKQTDKNDINMIKRITCVIR